MPIADRLLGIHIGELQKIPDELQVTLERKPDFTKRATNQNGKPFILHIEFQVKSQRKMVLRMQTYKALLQEKHTLPIEQFVIYLGKSRPGMKHRLVDLIAGEKTNYAFTLVNIQDYTYRSLLTSAVPEEIMLAILSDFQNEDPGTVVKQIIESLKRASDDTVKLQRYIRQLTVFAGLRNLREETRKQIETMAIETNFDISKDSLYLEGVEKGIEESKRRLVVNLLNNTKLSVTDIAQVAEVSQQYVEYLKQQQV